jgi:hypothetical protein
MGAETSLCAQVVVKETVYKTRDRVILLHVSLHWARCCDENVLQNAGLLVRVVPWWHADKPGLS